MIIGKKITLIGLTGGIASGKSTVAQMLRDKGVPVIDADALAKQVLSPGTEVYEYVCAIFPSCVKDGVLDRKALANIAFSSDRDREILEDIIHPRVNRLFEALLKEKAETHDVIVYDSALIFETRSEKKFDVVVSVYCDFKYQLSRLMIRNNLTEVEALRRMVCQVPGYVKRDRADILLMNESTLEALKSKVDLYLDPWLVSSEREQTLLDTKQLTPSQELLDYIQRKKQMTHQLHDKTEKTWVYVFIRTDLPIHQQMVQSAHAALEAGMRWPQLHKDPSSLIILQAKDTKDLHEIERFLDSNGIGRYTFFEPDWDYGYTAIGTAPLTQDQRTLMRKFKLWGR